MEDTDNSAPMVKVRNRKGAEEMKNKFKRYQAQKNKA